MARTIQEQVAYSAGYLAYPIPKDNNPYSHDINLSKQWIAGYEMAQDDYKEYLQSQSPLREEDYNA